MIDNVLPVIIDENKFIKLKGESQIIHCGDFIYIGTKVENITFILGWEVEECLIPRKFKNKYEAIKKIDLNINLQNAVEVSKNAYDFQLLEASQRLMPVIKIKNIFH